MQTGTAPTSLPAWCEPDMVMASEEHQIAVSPGGTLYMKPAETPEEQAEADARFASYVGQWGPLFGDERVQPGRTYIEGVVPGTEQLDDFGRPIVPVTDRGTEIPGQKRRPDAATRQFECHYSGCLVIVEDRAPFHCPHPDEGVPHMDYPFCSAQCASAWAQYEVGDPLADRIQERIEAVVGHHVEPARCFLEASMAALSLGGQTEPATIHNDDGCDEAEERQLRHKAARR